MNVNETGFINRLNVTDKDTLSCVDLLTNLSHFENIKKATLEEDKKGIDWWDNDVPIQFKVRYKQRRDCPVCIAQPFYGWDSKRTVKGRDLRCLLDSACSYYYTGILGYNKKIISIYRCKSKELYRKVINAMYKWEQSLNKDYGSKLFTEKITKRLIKDVRNRLVFEDKSGCQIWWKKNFNENYAKFNLYVSPQSLKSLEILYEN